MEQYDVGVIPLADRHGNLLGVVTDRDLILRVLAKRRNPDEVSLGEIATTNLITVSPDMNISQARDLMAGHRIRRLPVVKNGRPVGVVSLGDVAVTDASKRAVGEVLDEVSESPSTTGIRQEPELGTPQRVREEGTDRRAS
jgi:signal-transduction protein with cAMP-binding, CBS, and nucleotidyltransferase domain